MKRSALAWIGLAKALAAPLSGTFPSKPQAIEIHRCNGSIQVDGDLSDPGWRDATRVEAFFETSPGDNVTPPVATIALLAYDERFLYVGLMCKDPEPSRIRAPHVDRDGISDSDDHVTVLLDTRGDRRSAMEFRTNPQGQQTDGVYEDASHSEDLTPDFFYDSAARIGPGGWTAEMRIPFSSLRYSDASVKRWGILILRNYPRSFRHAIASVPIPRNSNCLVCRSTSLTGLSELPRGGHFVVAPYATLSESATPRSRVDPSLRNRPVRGNGGVDVKWTPSPGTALDGTVNPDFSQVESDVGQISVNSRFALFFPEKRPFFLEGVDLLQTPVQAIYTRTITSPRWGARATGKWNDSSYTLLVAQDRGGGNVVIPGSTESTLAPQNGSSIVAIGRLREDFGASFGGLLVTDREDSASDGGGHNRVLGADFQWCPDPHDKLTGQFLVSDTQSPNRPDLFPNWDGRSFASRAIFLRWGHDDPRWHYKFTYQDIGSGFRADDGFVPQVGFREYWGVASVNVYDLGILSQVQTGVFCDDLNRSDGALIQRQCGLYVDPSGIRNLSGEIDVVAHQRNLVGDRIVTSNLVVSVYGLSIDPGRIFSRISLSGFLGDSPDVVNARPGHGGDLNLTATLKPTLHLQLDLNGDRQWLDVDANGGRPRLFTAQIERLKATYNFTTRSFLRVIGQYQTTSRDPRLYSVNVDRKESGFSGSALLAYRLNWQTVAFLGYGDEREGSDASRLHSADRSFFLKLSYAFQH